MKQDCSREFFLQLPSADAHIEVIETVELTEQVKSTKYRIK